MNIAFYLAAVVAIISTVMVITRMNAVHALLYMIVSLFSVAVIMFTLGAPFVAALEVIVYAGAIMVLFIFVVMMLNVGTAEADRERSLLNPRAWIGPIILAVILGGELVFMLSNGIPSATGVEVVSPKEVGISMFTTYMLGVQMVAMLLLAGLVGAFHLGKELR